MRIVKFLLLATVITVALGACKKPARSLFYSYNQQAMLTNVGTNILVPGINNFATSANTTQTAIDSFISNPNSTTLVAAQTAFSQLAINWAAVEPFNFGPMTTNLWAGIINTWPVDTGKIQIAISTQANASTQGGEVKGLKALEYLLYDPNGNAAVLAKYTGGGAAALNQQAYLSSVIVSLAGTAGQLQSSWTGTGGYLATSFIPAQGNNVGSSVSLLVNSIAYFTDQLKAMKVANPIGEGVKVNDNLPHPNLIEYPISQLSVPCMVANLQAMQSVLDGGGTGAGLKDILTFVNAQQNGQSLGSIGDNDYTTTIGQLNGLTPPYSAAISNQLPAMKNIMTSLRAIIVYWEVDVAGDFGVSITFNDTDGD